MITARTASLCVSLLIVLLIVSVSIAPSAILKFSLSAFARASRFELSSVAVLNTI